MIEVTQTMVDLPHTVPKMTDPAAGTPAPEPEEDNSVAIGWRAGREDGGTVRGGGGAEGGRRGAGVLGGQVVCKSVQGGDLVCQPRVGSDPNEERLCCRDAYLGEKRQDNCVDVQRKTTLRLLLCADRERFT
jgi:hypothetical protein